MRNLGLLTAAVLAAALLPAPPAVAQQDWSPPSRQMPAMPNAAQLEGDWRGQLGAWFAGAEGISGVPLAQVRATGEGSGSGGGFRFVRFSGGVRAVAAWADRNGDGRCDMLEIFRSGTVAVQLIDPDYDGTADVLRTYDASGNLQHETRL